MIEGGCHCGDIRYEIGEDLIDCGYCHCNICRETTGAPVLVFATFPFESFTYSSGEPAVYYSSEWGQREFCSSCGTQICYRKTEDPEEIDVNIGSLDEPDDFLPEYHIYTDDQLEWLATDDELPRYPDERPPGQE